MRSAKGRSAWVINRGCDRYAASLRWILLATFGQVCVEELERLEGEHDGDSEPETEHTSDLRSHRVHAERRHVLQLDERLRAELNFQLEES